VVSRDLGLRPEFVQFWLTREWKEDWAPRQKLAELAARGVTPVAVHYYFGDDLSRERFEAARDPWYTSLWRMSQQIRIDAPVLVVLEPEWNQPAPPGETSLLDWDGFADDLRAAAELIRREAPNALVGTCVGDFAGPPRLERVLGPASEHLDFLAFQEMRAVTDPAAGAIYFQLVDDPKHRGYFGAAEKRFGLVDHRARTKRAWKAFRKLGS
jgi:hypothetical protein